MATISYSIEIPSRITGPEFMEFGPKDAHKHVSKSTPQLITKCSNIQGDGGNGTVRDFHFPDDHHFDYMKVHTDHIDMENKEYRFHLIEGGNIGKKFSEARYVFKVCQNESGQWMLSVSGLVTPLPGVELTDEDIEKEKNFWVRAYGIVEDYIETTPDHSFGKGSRPTSNAPVSFYIEVPSRITGPEYMEFGPRDAHKHMTNSIPHLIKKCDNIQGDGEVGSIRDMHLVDGHLYNHLKMHTDHIDMHNNEFRFHLLEGGNIGKKLSAAHYVFKVYQNENGQWIFRASGQLTPLPGANLTKEDIENEKNFWVKCYGIFEDYIESTPDHGFGKGYSTVGPTKA